MKKLFFVVVLLGLMICCSEKEQLIDDSRRTKRFIQGQPIGGVQISPELDSVVLMTEEEIIAYAAMMLDVNETNPEVTWIDSQDFYGGYARILLEVGTSEERAAFYDTLRIVPSKCFCVVNFSNASALIDPDRRSAQRWISGHIGITLNPEWFKWTDFDDYFGVTSYEDWFDMQDMSDMVDHSLEDCMKVKNWAGKYGNRTMPFVYCQSSAAEHHELCTESDLDGAYDDCDSIERSFFRSLRPIEFPIERPPFIEIPIQCNVNSDTDDLTPLEFMQLEYCEMIPYIERKLGWAHSWVPLDVARSFLNRHGITVTTYTGDNDAVVRHAILNEEVPLLYKDGEWSFVYKYIKNFRGCLEMEDTYSYHIDPCYPNVGKNVMDSIDSECTVVVLEF